MPDLMISGPLAALAGGTVTWLITAAGSLLVLFFNRVNKRLMAVICGAIAWSGKEQKVSRLIVAAVTGSLSYCVMYLGYSFFELLISGSAPDAAAIAMMTKAGATLFNAVVADVIAVPLFLAIRGALQRSHLWRGGKPGAAM